MLASLLLACVRTNISLVKPFPIRIKIILKHPLLKKTHFADLLCVWFSSDLCEQQYNIPVLITYEWILALKKRSSRCNMAEQIWLSRYSNRGGWMWLEWFVICGNEVLPFASLFNSFPYALGNYSSSNLNSFTLEMFSFSFPCCVKCLYAWSSWSMHSIVNLMLQYDS